MLLIDRIEAGIGKIINAFAVISTITMVLMMAYVAVDAVMRNLNRSFVGSNELIVNVVVVVIFLGIGQTSLKDTQIKIDVFKFLPWLDHVTLFFAFAIYVFSGIAAWNEAKLAFEMNLTSSFLGIARWPFLFITGAGLILCGLGVVCVELRYISTRHKEKMKKRGVVAEGEA
ncbi:MAG: TRAP transporter small permease [Clostridiales Family XIII bacterium]|jgi:TRAP-type C4-dicarboxylate transport system permease small subunit|nr:TRAP transporter small permease [Clostridiales Family XIII bacterium]